MGFPEDHISEGEQLVLHLKPHWWTFWKSVLILVIVFVVAVLLRNTAVNFLGWLAFLAALVYLGVTYAKWATAHFVVSSDRIIFRQGVLRKTGIEIPLNRVNNVIFNQSLFERILGAGDLTIESAGESGQSYFENVRKPDAVQNEINRQVELQRQRHMGVPAPQPQQAPPSDDIPARIEQLEQLREQGLISEEEYERKRTELLGRL